MLMGTKRDSVTAQRLYLGLFSLETLDLDPCNLSSLKGWFGNRRDIFFSPQGKLIPNSEPASYKQRNYILSVLKITTYFYHFFLDPHIMDVI